MAASMAVSGARWNHRETIALISLWKTDRVQQLMDGSTRNARAYEILSEDLRKMGYNRSSAQVKERMKRLKREYRQIILRKSIGDNCTRGVHWPYFNLVKSIVENQQITNTPQAAVRQYLEYSDPSSLCITTTNNEESNEAEDEELDISYLVAKPEVCYDFPEDTDDSTNQMNELLIATDTGNNSLNDISINKGSSTSKEMKLKKINAQRTLGNGPSLCAIKREHPEEESEYTPPDKIEKREFLKEVLEGVRTTQLEISSRFLSSYQAMEMKRVQLELDMEEKRLNFQKELCRSMFNQMQCHINHVIDVMKGSFTCERCGCVNSGSSALVQKKEK